MPRIKERLKELKAQQAGASKRSRDDESSAVEGTEKGMPWNKRVSLTPASEVHKVKTAGLGLRAQRRMADQIEKQFGEMLAGPPWDYLINGKDLLLAEMQKEAERQIAVSLVTHFGIDCKSFSRARDRPVPNAKSFPGRLRSDKWPLGLP